MKTQTKKMALLTAALGVGFGGAAHAQRSQVYLNGQPLQTEVAPMVQNGRTLVPMRDIFEALGATVNYNSLTKAIAAQRGNTTVQMSLGSKLALVNNQRVTLDVPAATTYGRTMVPLRFVSEAMGAKVDYSPAQRIVSIQSNGAIATNPGSGTQVGGVRQISIPVNTVVPVTMDRDLSSANARVGETFTATVTSAQMGDSEFPQGTRLQGVVREVQRKTGDSPGVLDLRFRNAILPDGTNVTLLGDLVSMDNDSVSSQNGRIVAKEGKGKSDTLKVVGIGAAAGFVLGKILKKDGVLPAVIGGIGGLLYDKSKNKSGAREATVPSGTRLGVRLNQRVTYRDTTGYYDQRSNYIKM